MSHLCPVWKHVLQPCDRCSDNTVSASMLCLFCTTQCGHTYLRCRHAGHNGPRAGLLGPAREVCAKPELLVRGCDEAADAVRALSGLEVVLKPEKPLLLPGSTAVMQLSSSNRRPAIVVPELFQP